MQIRLGGIRLASVNEYGQEAPPHEVWRHNHHHHHRTTNFLIYKRLVLEYQMLLKPYNSSAIELLSGDAVEVQVAVKRRVRDGEWMAVQLDVTVPAVKVDIPAHVVPLLAHTATGITYCLTKDREFVDPLKSTSEASTAASTVGASVESSVVDMATESFGVETEALANAAPVAPTVIPDELDEPSSSSSEEEENGDAKSVLSETPSATAPARSATTPDYPDRPVILLPNGIVIHERISLSLSVHHVSIRGTYSDGHIAVEAKGCITELIWPKVTMQKGGYLQTSLAYLSVCEQHGSKLRQLVKGGVAYNASGPVEQPGKPLETVGRDESFPLYEDRSVRPDPIGLRHTFPAQAFGAKTTVDFIPKPSENDSSQDDILFVNEIGVDRFDVVADAHAWCRIVRFALNLEGGGFDSRWFSGEWDELLTQGMLLRPSETLNLEEHLQQSKISFLDDDESVLSSDLFNVTSRLTKVCLRIPAAPTENLRSCDIVTMLNEAMLVVSSALPRTFSSGKVGAVGSSKTVDFPNDPSDIAYQLENNGDAREQGTSTSAFRLQIALRDYNVRLEPIIPFCAGEAPRQLVAPSDLTMLLCFEGEGHDRDTRMMAFFVSTLIQRCHLNLDLELLASAIGTLSYHSAVLRDASNEIVVFLPPLIDMLEGDPDSLVTDRTSARLRSTLRGRKALMKRQINRSRATGGMNIAVAVQVAESSLSLWRQNVLLRGRSSFSSHEVTPETDDRTHSQLKVCGFEVTGLDAGVDITFRETSRRALAKLCLSGAKFRASGLSSVDDNNSGNLVDVFRFGGGESMTPGRNAVALRVEEISNDSSRVWALSMDACDGVTVYCLDEIEATILLVLEALMMPTASKNHMTAQNDAAGLFPGGTVGALIQRLLTFGVPISGVISLDTIVASLSEVGVEESETTTPRKSVDAVLREFIKTLVPEDVMFTFARVTLNNTLAQFPGSVKSNDVGVLLHEAEFLASYSFKDISTCGLLNTIGRPGKTWSSVLEPNGTGLWHRMSSRQSVVLVAPSAKNESLEMEMVMEGFNFGYKYADSALSFTLEEGPSVEDVELLEESLVNLIPFVLRTRRTAFTITRVFAALQQSLSYECNENTDPGKKSIAEKDPVILACSGSSALMRSVADTIRKLNSRVDQFSASMQNQLSSKQKQIDELRALVFEKERDRLGAFGLVSAKNAGWLRLGAAQRSGQRGLLSCTLWPHWLVLRRNVLIVYQRPGLCEPICVIPLRGASLHELAGGRRKRELKRAFALADSVGTVYFLIAISDRDYCNWVRQLQAAVKLCSPVGATEDSHSESLGSDLLDNSRHSTGSAQLTRSQHGRPLGQSFSRAVMAAKATGRAVRGRVRRNEEFRESDSSLTDSSSPATNEVPEAEVATQGEGGPLPSNRGQQLRNRFAGVGQATKSRFGSAIQVAKQKGKNVAERRRRLRGTPEVAPLSTESDSPGVSGNPTTMGLSCSECTFMNVQGATTCQICESPLVSDLSDVAAAVGDVLAISTGASTPSDRTPTNLGASASEFGSVSGSQTEEDGGQRRGMRDRLGAAVRSVRKATPGTGEDESLPTDTDVLKLRNISVVHPLPMPVDAIGVTTFDEPEPPLKQLEGHWFVKVAPVVSRLDKYGTPAERSPASSSVEEPQANSTEIVDVESSEPQQINDGDGDPDRQLGSPTVDLGDRLVPPVVFQVQVFRRSEGGSRVMMTEFEKPVAEVLALHTALSETIGHLTSTSALASNGTRASSGDTSDSLASAFGLNAVETTKLTGDLLGGLLKSSLSDNPVQASAHGGKSCLLWKRISLSRFVDSHRSFNHQLSWSRSS